jgi:hypothetical protein
MILWKSGFVQRCHFRCGIDATHVTVTSTQVDTDNPLLSGNSLKRYSTNSKTKIKDQSREVPKFDFFNQ